MPLPRFRIRTIMVVVAAIALLTGGGVQAWRLNRLSKHYCQRAIDAGNGEAKWTKDAGIENYFMKGHEEVIAYTENALFYRLLKRMSSTNEYKDMLFHREEAKRLAARRDRYLARAKYYAELKRKYAHAARYPWLPVDPDMPEPDLTEPE